MKDPLPNPSPPSSPAVPRRMLFGLPPWLVAGVFIVLALAVAVPAWRSSYREEEIMAQAFLNRADALIWALEAGSRTWMGMRGEAELLQQLVEETAKQSGTVYLAVVDEEGHIFSHSQKERIGEDFPVDLPEGWQAMPEGESLWRARVVEDRRVFEVRRLFSPISGDQEAFARYHRGRHMMGMGMGRGMGMGMGMMGRGMMGDYYFLK